MRHRDVRASLYGIAAGIVLGAGMLALVQQAGLQANVGADAMRELHNSPRRSDYTRRNVIKNDVPLRGLTKNNYPTLKEDMGSSSSSASSPDLSPESCKAVRAAIAIVHTTYNAVIADTIRNTEIRTRMDAAFAKALMNSCPQVAETSSSAAVTSSPATEVVDNDCEKYPSHTARYTQCVIAEKNGKTYP